MEKGIEQRNKLFAFLFIFVVSIYIATMFHEIGHAIISLFFGCRFPIPYISPLIIGYTFCGLPSNFYESLSPSMELMLTLFGPGFVALMGLLFLGCYKKLKYVKNHWVLAIIFYCLAFNFLLNGSLQFLQGSDHSILVADGLNPVYITLIGLCLLGILFFQALQFDKFLLIIEPKIKMKIAKKLKIIFLILLALICVSYFALSFLL
jgi:hypothetical protein